MFFMYRNVSYIYLLFDQIYLPCNYKEEKVTWLTMYIMNANQECK